MAMAFARSDDQPLMELNTTPLIDVMLVLLVMFIVTSHYRRLLWRSIFRDRQ